MVTGVRAVTVSVMVAGAIVVTGMWTVTMAAMITSAIVVAGVWVVTMAAMITSAIVVTGVWVVTMAAMITSAIVVTGVRAVTIATAIAGAIVVTAVVSRRVRGMIRGVCCMMTMSVPAAFERLHQRHRHAVVAQLEQQAAAGGGRHVSGRDQRAHHNPRKQDRQTYPGCQRWIAHWENWPRFGRRKPVLHIVIQKPTPAIRCLR